MAEQRFAVPPIRYFLLWLFTIAAVLYIVAPMLIVIVNSFNKVAYSLFPPPGLSFHWYQNLAQQTDFYSAAGLSVVLGITSAAVALVVGTMASYALVRRKLPGASWIKSGLLSPIVMPKMVLGVGLFIFFAKIQIYGNFLSLMFAHSVISLPFVVALVTAALIGLDPSLEEAAADLGATPIVAFVRVVFPQIWISLLVSGLFAFIISFDQLESTIFLTRPGTTTLPIAMYDYTLKYQDPTVAALSTFVIAFSLLLVVILGVLLSRGNFMRTLEGAEGSLEGVRVDQ